MAELGKALLGLGVLLMVVGGGFVACGAFWSATWAIAGRHLVSREERSVFFPLGTSILLSVVLSVIFYVISRFRR